MAFGTMTLVLPFGWEKPYCFLYDDGWLNAYAMQQGVLFLDNHTQIRVIVQEIELRNQGLYTTMREWCAHLVSDQKPGEPKDIKGLIMRF